MTPGIVAGAVYLLISPHEPWGRSFPNEIDVQAWMNFLKSWLDHLGVLISLVLVSLIAIPRLRDPEVRVAIFLWLAAGSSMHAGPPLGMAMLGIVLLWSVVVSGERAVNASGKGALGVHLLVLGAPSLTLAAAPLGFQWIAERVRQRKELIMVLGWLALGGLLIWHFDLVSRNRFIYLWSEYLHIWERPLIDWMTPIVVLLSDPVLLMAAPGTMFLRRLGASPWLRWTLGLTLILGLLGTPASGVAIFFALAPLISLSIGSFLDREIAARSLWLGVVLGSVAASLHQNRFKTLSLDWVQPWWIKFGFPTWLGSGVQLLILAAAFYLVFRSGLRVGGFKARLARIGTSIGVAVLSAMLIALAHQWS